MFENLLYQDAALRLQSDITGNRLPRALLFAGPAASGKLTCALELARILSCRGAAKGSWQCSCASCAMHKALVNQDMALAGPRGCTLENAAAARTLLAGAASGAHWAPAARYLFLRSVRKLTARFSPVLLAEDGRVSKIAPLAAELDELLEELDPVRPLPERPALEKLCGNITGLCRKLESGYMYDSLPVSHIRSVSQWAGYTVVSGKKVVIIENAERMQDSVRNAMLKTLEEPPEDTLFILTTTRRGAVLPTILSRVRTYYFTQRSAGQQRDVISRVFHDTDHSCGSIEAYLQTFLPADPLAIRENGRKFVSLLLGGGRPDIESVCREACGFEPRVLLKVFAEGIARGLSQMQAEQDGKPVSAQARASELAAGVMVSVRRFYSHIVVYNQAPASALELLAEDIRLQAHTYGGGLII